MNKYTLNIYNQKLEDEYRKEKIPQVKQRVKMLSVGLILGELVSFAYALTQYVIFIINTLFCIIEQKFQFLIHGSVIIIFLQETDYSWDNKSLLIKVTIYYLGSIISWVLLFLILQFTKCRFLFYHIPI